MGDNGRSAFCTAGSSPIESELRRNGSTSTPAAVSWAISVSTMTFSPEGMASRYRLCATTTFTATNATVGGVPELPEVEALAAYLRERAVGHTVERFEVSSFSALKTYDGTTIESEAATRRWAASQGLER